jgi:predicted nucleic acid-binding protein
VIVLDAGVLIAHLDENDTHHERARNLLLEFSDARLGASVVTLAEVLVAPARAGRLEQAQALLRELDLEPIALGADAVSRLAALRAQTGLRMPDCCVIFAARLAAAEMLLTFDQQLARAALACGLKTQEVHDDPAHRSGDGRSKASGERLSGGAG